MLCDIDYYRDFSPRHGHAVALAPHILRIVADNPNDYTWVGTNTYLIGRETLALIDPGPADPAHIDAVAKAVAGRKVAAILLSHTHLDHSPAARAFSDRFHAPVLGHSLVDPAIAKASGEDVDLEVKLDREIRDGFDLVVDDWTLKAVHTKGHFPNHLCYALDDWLFSGDHVMGWATTVITPPLGNLCDYLDSLDRLLAMDFTRYLPSHGPTIDDPARYVAQVIGHRHARTRQILDCLARGVSDPAAIVDELYEGLTPRLVIAARGSVQAHLDHLGRRGQAVAAE